MHKVKYLFPLMFVILIGCSFGVTEDDLIGGTWHATAGYKDGKPDGEPTCMDSFISGLEFKEDGIVYGEKYDEDYEYVLEEWDSKPGITFILGNDRWHPYNIKKISEDEIGLTGIYSNDQSCFLERKE